MAGWPPIKIGGEWRPKGKGPHDDVEIRVAYGMFHAPTTAAMMDGVSLHHCWMSQVDDQWRVMLKGTRRGKPMVAFFYGPSWRDAIVLMVTSLDSGHAAWRTDTKPPKKG